MRILSIPALLAGAALLTAPAFAQTARAPAPATPAAPAQVTDAEVAKFTTALLAVEKIRKDTAVAETDKQTKMAAKINEAGLDPARYNEIAQSVQTDAALKQRVAAEVAKQHPPK
jgi:hypothetical protein